MEYTINEKYQNIKELVLTSVSKNPVEIAKKIMQKDFINIHGPEHHFLDGACFLAAYKNAGGNINIEEALNLLAERTIKMPGAMCGYWGVCGSVTSIGAALSIINKTTPLNSNEYYQDNMEFTSLVIDKMSKIGGPRCCKRNAFLSLSSGVEFVKNKYKIIMDIDNIICEFSNRNQQCININCPYFKKNNNKLQFI